MAITSRKTKLFLALFIYVFSYLPFTIFGKYELANYGGSDWRNEWHPQLLILKYVGRSGRSKSRFTPLGKLYGPCIFADRLFWHKTEFIE
jgi:hypothetical protein